MSLKNTSSKREFPFPEKEVSSILKEIERLEKAKENFNLEGGMKSTLDYFSIQLEINKLRRKIQELYEEWAKKHGLDSDSMEVFFHFSARTGIHKDSETEFFVVKKKEEDGEVFYLIDEVGGADDSSDEEDSDLWVRKSVLADCYPSLI